MPPHGRRRPRLPPAGVPSTAQLRSDAGEQLIQVEGFDQIVVGAQAEQPDTIVDRTAGGDHDNRHAGAGLTQPGHQSIAE